MINHTSSFTPDWIVASTFGAKPYVNMSDYSAGNVRYNGSINALEAYNGSVWVKCETEYASVGLTQRAIDVMAWAERRMLEDLEIEKLALTNNSVKLALENKKKAEEQLKVALILSKEQQ